MVRKILDFASSVKVAAVLLALIIIACIYATLYKEQANADKAVYQSFWFYTLEALFAANLLVCTLRKLRVNKKLPGFLGAHAGVLVIMLGGVINTICGEAGFLRINEGETSDSFIKMHRCLKCDGRGEHEQSGGKPAIACSDCKGRGYFTKEKELGCSIRLVDFDIEYYPPKFIFSHTSKHDKREIDRSFDLDEGDTCKSGDGMFSFTVKEFVTRAAEFIESEDAEHLHVHFEDGSRNDVMMRAESGAAFDIGNGVILTIIGKYNDWGRRMEPQESIDPINPVLKVSLSGAAGLENRWVFSRYPDHDLMHGGGKLYKGIRVFYHRGVTEKPAVRGALVHIEGPGIDNECLLNAENKYDCLLEYDKGHFFGYVDMKEITEYKSFVEVYKDARKVREHVIRVNHPLRLERYSLYQTGYDKEHYAWSLLHVKYSPGTWIVYVGFVFLCFGLVYYSFFYPALAKRDKS
jgi:hypothetical protein